MFKFIGNMLKSIGRTIASVTSKVAETCVRLFRKAEAAVVSASKWIWNTKPVQWLWNTSVVQWIAQFVGAGFGIVWSALSGPIGWLAGAILAIFGVTVLPVVLAVLLAALALGVVVWVVWLNNGKPKDVMQPIADTMVDMGEKDMPVTKDETYGERFDTINKMLRLAEEKDDPAEISEYFARLNLIQVRAGFGGKIPATAKVHIIHANTKMKAMARDATAPWQWGAMYDATWSEDKRWRYREALQEEAKKEAKAEADKQRDKAKKKAQQPSAVGAGNLAPAT